MIEFNISAEYLTMIGHSTAEDFATVKFSANSVPYFVYTNSLAFSLIQHYSVNLDDKWIVENYPKMNRNWTVTEIFEKLKLFKMVRNLCLIIYSLHLREILWKIWNSILYQSSKERFCKIIWIYSRPNWCWWQLGIEMLAKQSRCCWHCDLSIYIADISCLFVLAYKVVQRLNSQSLWKPQKENLSIPFRLCHFAMFLSQ